MNILKKYSLLLTCALTSFSYADEGKLVIGVEASREPFVYLNNQGKVEGFEVDLLTAIAKENGMEIEFSDMPFDALLPSVLTEVADAAISCIAITEERQLIVDFVGPYYEAGLNAMIRNDLKNTIKDSYDLSGKKICVVTGTTCEEYAASREGSELMKFSSEKESFDAIEHNQCDLLITDAPVIEYSYMKHSPDRYYKFNKNLTVEEFGIMTSKLRPEVKEKIALGLKKLEQNGEYDKLYKKWFGSHST